MSKTIGKTQETFEEAKAAILTEWRPQSAGKIKARFFDLNAPIQRLVLEKAIMVSLLKERGEKMEGIRYAGMWLGIAEGHIDLNVCDEEFLQSPNRARIHALPVPDQKRIAANPMVPVIERTSDGKDFTTRMMDVKTMPPDLARVVITSAGITPPDELKAKLTAQARRTTPPPMIEESGEHRTRSLTVKITEHDWEEVRIEAARARISEANAAYRIMLRGFKRPRI